MIINREYFNANCKEGYTTRIEIHINKGHNTNLLKNILRITMIYPIDIKNGDLNNAGGIL